MGTQERALELFRSGYNCSQSVFAAWSPRLGIDEKAAKASANGFGAGIGQLQSICGALSGAVMAIGVKYFDETNVAESKKTAYTKTREFLSRFEEIHGTTECIRLLGVNIRDPEGMDYAKQRKLFDTKCESYIIDACRLLDSMIGGA